MNINIRTRLTLQFTFFVGLTLLLFSSIIYFFSANFRESEFYTRLENKAVNTAKLLIQVKEVDHDLLKIIDKNTINALYQEKVVIYDYKNTLIYNSLDDDSIKVSEDLLNRIRLKKNIRYHQDKSEVIGLLYTGKNDRFVVISSALDLYGRSKLNYLRWILIAGFFISIALTLLIGRIYADRALKPMSNVVKQVDKITVSNLHTRVDEGNGKDEIAQLAITFNRMLTRMESAFEMQRSFVSNASHELRTPLTAITGQIEVSLMKLRSQEDYKAILESILEDIRNLNSLSNGLLDLARTEMDLSRITLSPLRFDEILWETRFEMMNRKKDYCISILFNEPFEDEKNLTITGNQHLLKTAIINLIDNGCKYSIDKSVEIYLSAKNNSLIAEFSDNGIGITKSDIKKIFQPFYRGENARNFTGNGLGLSLTAKIIDLHNGTIEVNSHLNSGTKIIVTLPLVS